MSMFQQDVKETCDWAHAKYKEKMAAVTTHQYLCKNNKCAVNAEECKVWNSNCKHCIIAKRHNAKLSILLSNF